MLIQSKIEIGMNNVVILDLSDYWKILDTGDSIVAGIKLATTRMDNGDMSSIIRSRGLTHEATEMNSLQWNESVMVTRLQSHLNG